MIVILAFFLVGCTTNNQTTVQEPNQVKESRPANITQENSENGETNEIIEKKDSEFLISEVGIKIIFPDEYTITKKREKNRRGSFVSYDFSYQNKMPSFDEIQFFSEESIRNFTDDCGEGADSICFMGDYPTLERYFGQKNAFNKGENYGKYELKKFNNRKFFVSFLFDPNGSGYEYTTFIGDTKIDIWTNVENRDQKDLSDKLFEKLVIKEI